MKKNKIAILSLLSFVAITGLTGCKTQTSGTSGGDGGDSGTTEPPIVTPEKETLKMGLVTVSFNEQTYDVSASFAALTGAARYELVTVNYGGTTIETNENYISGTVFNIGSYEDGIYEIKIRAISSNEERYITSDWKSGNKFCNVSHPKPQEQLVLKNVQVANTGYEVVNGKTHWYAEITYDDLPSGVFTTLYFYSVASTSPLNTINNYFSGHRVDLGELEEGEYTFSLKANGLVTNEIDYLTSEIVRADGNLVVENAGGNEPPVVVDLTKLVISNLQIDEMRLATWETNAEAVNFQVSVWDGEIQKYSKIVAEKRYLIETDTLELGETYTFKVKAKGDGLETEDSDTVQLNFQNGEKPVVQKKANEITNLQFTEVSNQNIRFMFDSLYFEEGLIVCNLKENGTEIFRKQIDENIGYFKINGYYGKEITITLTIAGNWEYEEATATQDFVVPANSAQQSASITQIQLTKEGNNLVITPTITGTYTSVVAIVVPAGREQIELNDFVGGKFTLDISEYGDEFEAQITVNIYNNNGTVLDTMSKTYPVPVEDDTTAEFDYTFVQNTDGNGNRTFEVTIAQTIENVTNFSYEILKGEISVVAGSANYANYNSTKKITFGFDGKLLTTGETYQLLIDCQAQDGKIRNKIKNFVAIYCETIEQEEELDDIECYISGYYKDDNDNYYRFDSESINVYVYDIDSECVESENPHAYEVTKLVRKSGILTWTLVAKDNATKTLVIKQNENTLEYIVVYGNVSLSKTTKPVNEGSEIDISQNDVLTVIRNDYGASYSNGSIDVTQLWETSTGSTTYSAYFTQADLLAGYVDKNGVTLNSSSEELKTEFDGVDLYELLAKVRQSYADKTPMDNVLYKSNVSFTTTSGTQMNEINMTATYNSSTKQITVELIRHYVGRYEDHGYVNDNYDFYDVFETITISW